MAASGASGVTFSLAQNLANLPPGTSIVTADGTPIVLDGSQQLVIQTSDDGMGASGKETPSETQLRTFWQRWMERIRLMKPVSAKYPVSVDSLKNSRCFN